MKANNALILLWAGESIPDYMVQKVAEVLITGGLCIPEMLTIKYKDENSIANALLRDDLSKDGIIIEKKSTGTPEEVKQAIIYIGERFKASLSGTNSSSGNLAMFAIELNNAVITARRNISFTGVGSQDELLTAIEIISTVDAIVPQSLVRKYHFTQNVIDVIKKIYNS